MKYNIDIENLKRMHDHVLLNVDERYFDMGLFSNSEKIPTHKGEIIDLDYLDIFDCGTTGCVVGHSASLDYKNIMDNYSAKVELPFSGFYYRIDFYTWSLRFINIYEDPLFIWEFLFCANWSYNEKTRTKNQALARMRMLIEKGEEFCFNKWNPDIENKFSNIKMVSKSSFNFEVIEEEFLNLTPYNHVDSNKTEDPI